MKLDKHLSRTADTVCGKEIEVVIMRREQKYCMVGRSVYVLTVDFTTRSKAWETKKQIECDCESLS